MCPSDDSFHTYEYEDHYVIAPSIKFYQQDMDFTHNKLAEKGQLVAAGYEYQSGSNPHFLSVEEILAFDDSH